MVSPSKSAEHRSRVAVIQMTSAEDKEVNLKCAEQLIAEAASQGAKLVALPELFSCLGDPEKLIACAEEIPGTTSDFLSELAKKLNVILIAGSISERISASEKISNSSLLFDEHGKLQTIYRKRHLFDIDIPGKVSFQESSFMQRGNDVVSAATSVGKIGLAICYDLRFPEHFRALADLDTELIVIPSAFTMATGRDHWEVLLRARAIENQAYVIAPNQLGRLSPEINTYGRSMIIDPWGTVLATAPDQESIIYAEIDLNRLREIRTNLPALQHRLTE